MRITNKQGLPAPLVDAVTTRPVVAGSYSATELLKGVTATVLYRRHFDEIEEDAADRIWAIFGTAAHMILESAEESPEQIKEGAVSAEIEGATITGRFDLYDGSTGTVTDYKTATVIKCQKGDYSDYRRQTLIYCWLLRKIGFDAHRGEIVMLLRDWVKSKAKAGGYPESQVQRIEFDFSPDDFAEIETWLADRIKAIRDAEKIPDNELEPCTDEERWHKPDTWAVTKDGCKRAYRVLESEEEAETLLGSLKGYHIEPRPGADARCLDYCSVAQWCRHGRDMEVSGDAD